MQQIEVEDGEPITIHINAGDSVEKILAATGIDLLEPNQHELEIQSIAVGNRLSRKIFEAIYDGDAKAAYERITPMKLREAVASEVANFIQGVDELFHLKLLEARAAEATAMEIARKKLPQVRAIYGEELEVEINERMSNIREYVRKTISTTMAVDQMEQESVTASGSTESADTSTST